MTAFFQSDYLSPTTNDWLRLQIYKRNEAGAETLLETIERKLASTNILQTCEVTTNMLAAWTVAPTDRLVYQLAAKTDNAGTSTLITYLGGSAGKASHVTTGIGTTSRYSVTGAGQDITSLWYRTPYSADTNWLYFDRHAAYVSVKDLRFLNNYANQSVNTLTIKRHTGLRATVERCYISSALASYGGVGLIIGQGHSFGVHDCIVDAAYVALAEALDATLVTRDERLAGAPGLGARNEIV